MRTAATPAMPRILVVDDERSIAISLVAILQAQGYRAVAAFDGEDALHTARHFLPQLLLADVVMPGINGIELAMAMAEMVPECKVLLFSGQAHSMDLLESARKRGFDFQVIGKPIPPQELLQLVSKLLLEQVQVPASR